MSQLVAVEQLATCPLNDCVKTSFPVAYRRELLTGTSVVIARLLISPFSGHVASVTSLAVTVIAVEEAPSLLETEKDRCHEMEKKPS